MFEVKQPATDGEPNTLLVSSRESDQGSRECAIDANATGDELAIAFNSRFLIELLTVMVTEGSYTFVIMPMHIG